MATQPETNFKKRLFKRLDSLSGCWYFKTQLGAVAGIPDVVGLYRGRFFAWELKAKNGKPTAIQLRMIKVIKDCGGISRVVYPSDMDEALKELTTQTVSFLH